MVGEAHIAELGVGPPPAPRGHTAGVGTELWSRDGKLLATASYDIKTPLVWDVESRKVIRRFGDSDPAIGIVEEQHCAVTR